MRFVHTADWQIGMKAVHLGENPETARRARFQSARRIIEIAREQGADFLILAGDTFEHHGIERAKVREIAKLLNLSPKTVETHRAHIKDKLDLKNSREVARFALQWLQARGA